jgi:hypothetical protein
MAIKSGCACPLHVSSMLRIRVCHFIVNSSFTVAWDDGIFCTFIQLLPAQLSNAHQCATAAREAQNVIHVVSFWQNIEIDTHGRNHL